MSQYARWPVVSGGSGTVTSVGLSAPAIFSVSGSPVTTSGTLTLALATESANTVFAGPVSGGAATPTFRALVNADVPGLSGGSPGQILRQALDGSFYWSDLNDVANFVTWYDDFLGNPLVQLQVSASGAGSQLRNDGTANTVSNVGVLALITGTGTTGQVNLYGSDQDDNFICAGLGPTKMESIVRLSALSDGTDTYSVVAGIRNGAYVGTIDTAAGIYWSYAHTENGGNWTLKCTNASTTTARDSGVAASASVFQRLGFIINSAGTSVQGQINGVNVGAPITTNIPAISTKHLFQWLIVKSAGTNSRRLYLDAYKYQAQLVVPR